MEILVIGAGVAGLSTALRLREHEHDVRVWAKDLPPATTSNVAAAVWYPYRAFPLDKVAAWGAITYREFARLANDSAAGVLIRETLEVRPEPSPDPWWVGAVEGFQRLRADELPAGYRDGYRFLAPVIDTSVYLDYLLARCQAADCVIEQRAIAHFDEALAACPIVVNCAGLGARKLANDSDLHAARGQVIRIAHTGFQRVLLDDEGPNKVAYIVPRMRDTVLGGIDTDGDERLSVDEAQNQSILRRCANLVESFDPTFAANLRALLEAMQEPANATEAPAVIREYAVGLRPVRSSVRLELEEVAPGKIIAHNYGHGGAGVTLSWGCADEVAALIDTLAQ